MNDDDVPPWFQDPRARTFMMGCLWNLLGCVVGGLIGRYASRWMPVTPQSEWECDCGD